MSASQRCVRQTPSETPIVKMLRFPAPTAPTRQAHCQKELENSDDEVGSNDRFWRGHKVYLLAHGVGTIVNFWYFSQPVGTLFCVSLSSSWRSPR